MIHRSNVYIIAGANGSGKTTFAREFLLKQVHCSEFVNADFLAQGFSPFAPESVAIKAGRYMLQRIKELFQTNKDFAFETTLSGKAYLRFWTILFIHQALYTKIQMEAHHDA